MQIDWDQRHFTPTAVVPPFRCNCSAPSDHSSSTFHTLEETFIHRTPCTSVIFGTLSISAIESRDPVRSWKKAMQQPVLSHRKQRSSTPNRTSPSELAYYLPAVIERFIEDLHCSRQMSTPRARPPFPQLLGETNTFLQENRLNNSQINQNLDTSFHFVSMGKLITLESTGW